MFVQTFKMFVQTFEMFIQTFLMFVETFTMFLQSFEMCVAFPAAPVHVNKHFVFNSNSFELHLIVICSMH